VGWGDEGGIEFEELEKIADEDAVVVELAGVIEEGLHDAECLLEGLIEERQVAEADQAAESLPEHPTETACG
jgi:hypothetical protein